MWEFPDVVLPVVVPAFACTAFAREREQRTWQDVLLTRLTTSQILSGKVLACLLPILTTVAILFPPYLLVLIISGATLQFDAPDAALIGLKLLTMSCFYLSLALICSYHSPNPRVALVVTYSALAFLAIVHWAGRPFLMAIAEAWAPIFGLTDDSGYRGLWSGNLETFVQRAMIAESVLATPILFAHLTLSIRRRRS